MHKNEDRQESSVWYRWNVTFETSLPELIKNKRREIIKVIDKREHDEILLLLLHKRERNNQKKQIIGW